MNSQSYVRILVAVAIGAVVGMGGSLFFYAKGYSYLSNDPTACANCHVMGDHLASWGHSSHKAVAACNDCHLPQGLVQKAWAKGMNGLLHGAAFTQGGYPDPLQIRPGNREIVEAACRSCHQDIVHAIDRASAENNPLTCVKCHVEVGHPR